MPVPPSRRTGIFLLRRQFMRAIQTTLAVAALALLGVSGFSSPAFAKSKKIVFLAGPKDHGAPGRHEYEKDLRVLAYCLEHSSNVKGITTKVYVGKAPSIQELKDAAVIVVESSADRAPKEHHPLFPQDATTDHKTYDAATLAYLKEFDDLMMKKGVGLVVFHYATWIQNETGHKYFLKWMGGAYLANVSKNPVDQWTMSPKSPNHPILQGVKPWTYKEEMFSKFELPDNPKRTDLVIGTPAKSPIGPQVAAFAYERGKKGRSFLFGGNDWLSNLLIEDDRRLLLNGILWAAKIDVPKGGVASTLTEELMRQAVEVK
jgi:type 1 glutamine amidotransferase